MADACSDGNYIYPNFSGTYFYDCPNGCPAIPIYNSTNAVYIVNSSNDGLCGVARDSFVKKVPYQRCKIKFSNGNLVEGAGLGTYTSTMNSCPIDGGTMGLLSIVLVFAFYKLKNRKNA